MEMGENCEKDVESTSEIGQCTSIKGTPSSKRLVLVERHVCQYWRTLHLRD